MQPPWKASQASGSIYLCYTTKIAHKELTMLLTDWLADSLML